MSDDQGRLRPPPTERLGAPELTIDTGAALDTLRQERTSVPLHGHRQIAVFHRGPVRMVLFAFQPGAELPEHSAVGIVSIHALRGTLTVRTPTARHTLSAGMLLVLDPGIRHHVAAVDAAEMLLTVHRTEPVPISDI